MRDKLRIETVKLEDGNFVAQILDGSEVFTFDAKTEKGALLGLLKYLYKEFKYSQKTIHKIGNLV